MSERVTLVAACSHVEEIKKSRFLTQAAPITSVDEAMAFIARVSVADATHNCWAYLIGQDYRFNDDGEPAGTAGRPILQAIEGQGYDRVVVVVTRWYGGTKLGAGGLARAYGGGAAECLRTAEHVPIIALQRVSFELGFAELPVLRARVQDWQCNFDDEQYGAKGVSVTATLPAAHVEDLRRLLADLSRGRSALRLLD